MRLRSFGPASLALLLVASLGALLAPKAALADSSTVNVIALDPDGKPKDFADVVAKRTDGTSFEDPEVTDDAGKYSYVGLAPGTYVFSASADGMASDDYQIELASGTTRNLTLQMKKLGVTEEVVEVRAPVADLIRVDDVSVSNEISGDFITKVPIINRRIEDITAMMPGVIKVGGVDSSDISIGGGSGAQISYRIDGQAGNDAVNGGLLLEVPSAAIQSFKLITSGASAKYGEQSTGVAEITTKSGGNDNDFSYELQFRDTDYGGQGNPEMDVASKAVNDVLNAAGTVLEQEVKAGFRLLGVDPVSTTADDNNPPPRRRIRHSISAGGPIIKDKAWFHSTLEVLQDDFGSAFVPGFDQNDNILWTSKVNWNLWSSEKGASNRLELTTNLENQATDGFVGLRAKPSVNTIFDSTVWTLGLTDTHVFENHGVLETKLSLQHQYDMTRPDNVRAGVGTSYEVYLPPGGPTSYFVGDATTNNDESISTIRAEGNYSKAVGTHDQHTLEVGIQADQVWFDSYQENGTTVTDLRVLNDTNLFQPPRSFVGRAVTYGPPLRTSDEAWYAGIYADDNWQVTPNFVLQLGLRAEYQSFVGKPTLGPRVGFSLDPIGDKKTRFFGNWGLYYDRLFGNFLQVSQQPDQLWGTINFTDAYFGAQRRFSQISIEDIYKDAQGRTRNTAQRGSIAYLTPEVVDRFRAADNLTAPTNKDWSLGISRELPGNVKLEVSYRENARTHQITNTTITRRNPAFGEPTVRDVVYGTAGEGHFRQWSADIEWPVAKLGSMSLSYVQSHNRGPVGPPQNPIDPSDVFYLDATLGNDRTHVIKLQATTRLGRLKPKDEKKKPSQPWNASIDFTWETGLPQTASLFRDNGIRLEPIGRNSLRLPDSRYLNFGVSKSFQLNTAEGGGFLPTIGIRAQVFNVLNDLNVTGALVQFKVPPGISNPQSFPPLRPDIIPTDIDVTRSLEVGFSIGF